MRFQDHIFVKEEVLVDGNEYVKCKFDDCTMIFGGTAIVRMAQCSFNNVKWSFTGAAMNTISFMTAMYSGAGEGGRQLIEQTFNNIRQGAHPRL